jgi:hypothetical protein
MLVSRTVAALVLILLPAIAHAQSAPRSGLRPGVIQQLPGRGSDVMMRPQEFETDRRLMAPAQLGVLKPQMFKVENHGNKGLNLKFWNAEGAWQGVSIAAASQSLVACVKCDKTVQLAFNDSQRDRYYSVPLEGTVIIEWNDASKTWELSGANEVPPPKPS